jgi:uncharacterized protein (TIGR01777 family)
MGQKIILAGGTGFLGQNLANELVRRGYRVIILSRSVFKDTEEIRYLRWDGRTSDGWRESLNGALAIINLAGRSINCRYTAENRKEIFNSRINSVSAIGKAIRQCEDPPKIWIQCASSGIYGDAEDCICDEQSEFGEGFAADICKAWETAFNEVQASGVRKITLRIGFVLGKNGGALRPLAHLAKLFLGGTTGTGKQYISWIHEGDFTKSILWFLEHSNLQGVFNVCGPTPVRNADFMKSLRKVFHRPWSPPVPEILVKLGARFVLRTEAELALTGRRCLPRRLLESGFEFEFTDLTAALENLLVQ